MYFLEFIFFKKNLALDRISQFFSISLIDVSAMSQPSVPGQWVLSVASFPADYHYYFMPRIIQEDF